MAAKRKFAKEAAASLFTVIRRPIKLRGVVYEIGDQVGAEGIPRHKDSYSLVRQKRLRPATEEDLKASAKRVAAAKKAVVEVAEEPIAVIPPKVATKVEAEPAVAKDTKVKIQVQV